MQLLWREVREVKWEEFEAGLTSVPLLYLGIAAFLIALNYGLLIAYDLLALRYICRSLPLRRVALVSFLGFSLGNNLGTLVAGTPIRFRFYGRWGIKARQIVVLISAVGLTFWSGVWFLGGVVLVSVPFDLPDVIELAGGTQIHLPMGPRASARSCCVWRSATRPFVSCGENHGRSASFTCCRPIRG